MKKINQENAQRIMKKYYDELLTKIESGEHKPLVHYGINENDDYIRGLNLFVEGVCLGVGIADGEFDEET